MKFRNAFKLKKLSSICLECGLYSPVNVCMSNRKLLRYSSMDGLYYLVGRK